MSDKNATQSMFSRLHHITIVVKDIEKAEKFYLSVGIGPFESPATHGTAEYVERTLHGKPFRNQALIRETNLGPIVFQLVQETGGESLVTEFVRKKGEGVFHLGFEVDDVDREEAKAVKLGLKVTSRGRRADGSGNAFFDTEEQAGVILQIRQTSGNK